MIFVRLKAEFRGYICGNIFQNDIYMFNITPNSIAMGNSLECVKKHAKYITASNDEDGVAKALEKL